MPPKRTRKEESVAKSIDDMNEEELHIFVTEKEVEVAELTDILDKARGRLIELQSANSNLSFEDRFMAWNENGPTKITKTLSELRKTIIGDLLANALSDGCVNKHETKTADCILDIAFDYAGGQLSKKDEEMLQYLMDNNIGHVRFE